MIFQDLSTGTVKLLKDLSTGTVKILKDLSTETVKILKDLSRVCKDLAFENFVAIFENLLVCTKKNF